jgi:hypothetical protein
MKRNFSIFLLLACAAGFAFGLLHLFQLRFAAGDVYPEYSSLRADPLGTMAFCESLERMPGLSVRRDFNAGNDLPEGKNTVYLHLAARTLAWTSLPDDLTREIEHFLAAGGRLAVTFFPEASQPRRPLFEEDRDAGNAEKRKKPANEKIDRRLHQTRLQTWWGLDFAFVPLDRGEAGSYQPASVVNKTDLPLPATLAWHSAAVFTNLAKSWRTIYARGTNPVVIERRFGPGTVVLATDSYFVSNEALRKDRQPDLLAWLVGPSRTVVFDEAHFGIVDTSGVASLIRKYRLHGLALALLLLAGLFLWQNAVSFVPPTPEERAPDYVPGKEAAAGFVNLLRRNVSPRDVLQTCFAEWKKSFSRGARPSAARIIQAQAVLDAENALPLRQRDPVRAYQQICGILKPAHSRNPNPIPQAAPNAEGPERRHPAGLGRPDGVSRQDAGAPPSKSQDNQTNPQ